MIGIHAAALPSAVLLEGGRDLPLSSIGLTILADRIATCIPPGYARAAFAVLSAWDISRVLADPESRMLSSPSAYAVILGATKSVGPREAVADAVGLWIDTLATLDPGFVSAAPTAGGFDPGAEDAP